MVSPTFGMEPDVNAPHLHMVTELFNYSMADMLQAHSRHWSVAQWILIAAAIFLLVIDNTEWKSPLLVGLLVPLIFFNAPDVIFKFFRGEPGHWIAVIIVLGILYTPPVYIPPPTNLWSTIILLIVVSPAWLVHLRYTIWAVLASLVISLVLATQHVTDAHANDPEGPRAAFTQQRRLPTTVALLLTIAIPIYMAITYLFNWA